MGFLGQSLACGHERTNVSASSVGHSSTMRFLLSIGEPLCPMEYPVRAFECLRSERLVECQAVGLRLESEGLMKRVNAELTDEQLIELIANDPIGRNQEIADFLALIDKVEGGYSFFLNASWGDGKTVFVKQTALALAVLNENLQATEEANRAIADTEIAGVDLSEPYMPVYYNAWKNDSLGDPLPTLIATIASEHGLLRLTKDGPAIVDAAAGALDVLLKPFNLNVVSDVKNVLDGKDYLETFNERKGLQDKVCGLVDRVLEERANKLVLFVDEIDRCSPTFALRLLEELKFLFEYDRVIMVFSIDMGQLASAISGAYGSEFDGGKYLQRFYDRIIPLSKLASTAYLSALGFGGVSGRFDSLVTDLANVSALSMRETNVFLESLDEVRDLIKRSSSRQEEWGSFFFCVGIVPVLLLVKLLDIEAYDKVVHNADPRPVIGYLKTSQVFKELNDVAIENIAPQQLNGDVYQKGDTELIADLCTIAFGTDSQSERYRLAYRRLQFHASRLPSIVKRVL